MLSFAQRPLALIGVAEKGYADLLLSTKGKGGHASMPPKDNATVNLAKAIIAIQDRPFPARITRTLAAFLRRLSTISTQPYKLLFRFAWLTGPFIKAAFSATHTTNALIRSTVASTMLEGSPKENVLAEKAQATLNVRILPGETSASIIDRLNALAAPFGAEITAKHKGQIVEASNESSVSHEGWGFIEKALSRSHPEAFCLPFLFSAATDTKHYRDVAQEIYRFAALPQTQEDLTRVHAANERVKVTDLERCAAFYMALIGSL
jgi:carboxypeptidase PM20D1